ncbi:snake venom vascular endothelial growth factor toxin HF-like [Anolis carolinensis]|uniref:snake venom vascular endothelial growth factor toxin HF-like n=1 Tax=Anolis carolinensis TaxID=28377 RepID=UPI002F2B8AD0
MPVAIGFLLLALFFHGVSCKQLKSPSEHQAGAVPFAEVWRRSYCRSRETLVDILAEFPHEAEHIFKPPCVPLWRCAGCCGDESLECAAVETRTIDLQVVRVSPILGKTRQEAMTFTEHTRCVCRPRRKRLKKERIHRIGAKRKPREPETTSSAPLSCQRPDEWRHDASEEVQEETMDMTETENVPGSWPAAT